VREIISYCQQRLLTIGHKAPHLFSLFLYDGRVEERDNFFWGFAVDDHDIILANISAVLLVVSLSAGGYVSAIAD
jgi:hypothetical protein